MPNTSSSAGAGGAGGSAKGGTKEKKKPKNVKPCFLKRVRPINIDAERDKFVADPSYNPQFEYANGPPDAEALAAHQPFSTVLLPQADAIIEKVCKQFGSWTGLQRANGGEPLKKEEAEVQIAKYIEDLGLTGTISVNLDPKLVPAAMMQGTQLNVRVGAHSAEHMRGCLDHEIGTHYLRKHNEAQQSWGGKKRSLFGLSGKCIATEEGLATLNTHLNCQHKFLYKAAVMYVAAVRAQTMSFSELSKSLEGVLDDPVRRWEICLRVKRGVADTSQPGGLAKDQVYLEGAVNLLSVRHNIDFRHLYFGKVSLKDIARAAKFGSVDKLLLPHFLRDDAAISAYKVKLDEIAVTNGLA